MSTIYSCKFNRIVSSQESHEQLRLDRVSLINKFSKEANELFSGPKGLDIKGINALSIKRLEQIFTLEVDELGAATLGTFKLFPYNDLDVEAINALSDEEFQFILDNPIAGAFFKLDPSGKFDAKGFKSIFSSGKLEILLDYPEKTMELFEDEPQGGLIVKDILSLSNEELMARLRS